LAAELEDKPSDADFVELNALDKNFHDEIIPAELFPDFYQKTIEYIVRLEVLAGSGNS